MKDMKEEILTFTIGNYLASGLNVFYKESCKNILHILHGHRKRRQNLFVAHHSFSVAKIQHFSDLLSVFGSFLLPS